MEAESGTDKLKASITVKDTNKYLINSALLMQFKFEFSVNLTIVFKKSKK